MEKMPFREAAETEMDVHAVIADASSGAVTVERLASVAAGADRHDGDAPGAAAVRRAVAAGHAVDRGGGALHLAAADDDRGVRAIHRLDPS